LNIILAALFCFSSAAHAAHTQVNLLLSAETAKPGETILAGIQMRTDPQWHTYWKNSGASGIATSLKWELPPGISTGEIQWPIPEKLGPDELTTYIYENETVLLVPLKLAPDLKPGSYPLKVSASWLECKEQCVPGNADASATLTIGTESKPSAAAAVIQPWQTRLPKVSNELNVRAWWEKPQSEKVRAVVMEWSAPGDADKADFYPFANDNYEVQGATEHVATQPGTIRVRKQVKKFEGEWPKQLSGVIIQKDGNASSGFEVSVTVQDSPPQNAAATSKPPAPFSWVALLSSLGFAFLGGLILNIMPCVLPVIALKIFSFVKQSGESPKRARALALVYTLGILCSFLVLAGFLIAAQKTGEAASWGMQMQNRNFLIGMTILVLLVSLNLFGLFEVTLGAGAMNAATNLSTRNGFSGTFFNGVLATALAIPCTAPFLATALAFAFAQPPAIILLTFSFIAFGLASPYIVLTWNPKLLRFLPKPGPWMNRFKVALGFVMLMTVVWLYKLSLNHLNKSQSLWFGIFLVIVSLATWIWGEFVQRGNRRKVLAAGIAVVLVVASGVYASTRGEGIKWQPWSTASVEAARKDGRPVLVDFTADWCLTCQLNLRSSIDVQKVREKLAETHTATLIGDYTLRDKNIGEELHRFGRDAVPLVVVFPKNPSAEPIVLPPLLTPQIVLDALDRASR
jgi:thiol:disulfide interchange protein DsbD